jgi:hypothetical protein
VPNPAFFLLFVVFFLSVALMVVTAVTVVGPILIYIGVLVWGWKAKGLQD